MHNDIVFFDSQYENCQEITWENISKIEFLSMKIHFLYWFMRHNSIWE